MRATEAVEEPVARLTPSDDGVLAPTTSGGNSHILDRLSTHK